MAREFDPDSEFEDNFLILKLSVNSTNQIVFSDLPISVGEQLEGIVNSIVKQSEHIPRPENGISTSKDKDKKDHLWPVPQDEIDGLVSRAKSEISEILEQNMSVVEKALHVYDDYTFILKERAKVELFLSDPLKFEKVDFATEISRYDSTMKKIRDTMPKELRMNMFMIDCTDLNARLCSECDLLVERILQRASDYVLLEKAVTIFQQVKQIGESFGLRANNSTKDLVDSEQAFDRFKLVTRAEVTASYTDLVDWLCFLYSYPRLRLFDEQTKSVTQAHNQVLKINSIIESKERTLQADRNEIENKLETKKSVFKENLNKIKVELDRFKEYNTKRSEDEYNKQIAQINAELINLTTEMREINEME